MKRKTRAAQTTTFKSYLSAIRQRGDLRIEGVSSERLKRWMANENRRKRILDAREAYLARQPQPTDAVTPSLAVEEAILEENLDPHSIIFESKIVPRIEADILKHGSAPGHFYWEATLAAINLPGWVDRIARYARADLKAFFIELGNALSAKRHLWDEKDELIACNYYSTTQLKKPLSQMTEKDASSAVNLPEAAYDKRLLRLGIRKKVGRPRKQKPDDSCRFFPFRFLSILGQKWKRLSMVGISRLHDLSFTGFRRRAAIPTLGSLARFITKVKIAVTGNSLASVSVGSFAV